MAEANTNVKIYSEHPEYVKYMDAWTLYQDTYNGEGGYEDGTYLVPHPLELESDNTVSTELQKRMELSWYINYPAKIIDAKHTHLFKKVIVRTSKNTFLKEWLSNCDGKGTDFGNYLKMTQLHAQIYGHMFVFMDRPTIAELVNKQNETGSVSRADEKAAGAIPYLYSASPLEVVDWGLDRAGAFEWIKVKEIKYRYGTLPLGQVDPLLTRTEVPCLRIWTRLHAELYDITDKSGAKILETFVHNLGIVPVVIMYNRVGKRLELSGKSEVKDLADLALRLFNLLSELDEWLRNQAFSLLTFPVSAEDKIPAEGLTVGTGRMLRYNAESRSSPDFIAADASHAKAYEDRIKSVIEEMHRMGHMKYKGGVSQSGSAWAFDWEEVNNSLRGQAQETEKAEKRIVRIWDVWQTPGQPIKEIGLDYTVHYPETYSYSDEETEMAILTSFTSIAPEMPSETFVKEFIIDRFQRFLPNLSAEIHDNIRTEVEKYSTEGIIKIRERLNSGGGFNDESKKQQDDVKSDRKRIDDGGELPPSKSTKKDNSGVTNKGK